MNEPGEYLRKLWSLTFLSPVRFSGQAYFENTPGRWLGLGEDYLPDRGSAHHL